MFPTEPIKPTPPTPPVFKAVANKALSEWVGYESRYTHHTYPLPLDVAEAIAEEWIQEDWRYAVTKHELALAKHAEALAVYERRLAHWRRVQEQVSSGDAVRAHRNRYMPHTPPRKVGPWRVWVEYRQPKPTDRGVRPAIVALRHYSRRLPDGRTIDADADLTQWGEVTWRISINVSREAPDGYVWRTILKGDIGGAVQWPMALQWVKRAAGVR